jgi:hypothetical protein
MKLVEPWSDSEFSMGRIRAVLSVLVGKSLKRVRYAASEFAIPEVYSSYTGFDIVLKGVELTTSSEVVTVMWMMDGVREGLGFVLDPDEQFYEDENLHTLDMSNEPRWTSLLHQSVSSTGASWQISDENAPRSIWSFRINFRNGRSVAIALGESNELSTGLIYQPDSVAVIFEEPIARRYRILASAEPAWGSPTP